MTQILFTAMLTAAIFLPAVLVIDEHLEEFTIWLFLNGFIK